MKRQFVAGRRVRVVLWTAAALSPFVGCATMDTPGGGLNKLAAGDPAAALKQPAAPAPTYTVEVRAQNGKPAIRTMPLTGPTLVQQALEQSGAAKRFRRIDVTLMRSSGDERHKLEVRIDPKLGTVKPPYDYAVVPGDHLVVTENTATVFGDMFKDVAPAFGRAARR